MSVSKKKQMRLGCGALLTKKTTTKQFKNHLNTKTHKKIVAARVAERTAAVTTSSSASSVSSASVDDGTDDTSTTDAAVTTVAGSLADSGDEVDTPMPACDADNDVGGNDSFAANASAVDYMDLEGLDGDDCDFDDSQLDIEIGDRRFQFRLHRRHRHVRRGIDWSMY
jgi:hypothetical protein